MLRVIWSTWSGVFESISTALVRLWVPSSTWSLLSLLWTKKISTHEQNKWIVFSLHMENVTVRQASSPQVREGTNRLWCLEIYKRPFHGQLNAAECCQLWLFRLCSLLTPSSIVCSSLNALIKKFYSSHREPFAAKGSGELNPYIEAKESALPNGAVFPELKC